MRSKGSWLRIGQKLDTMAEGEEWTSMKQVWSLQSCDVTCGHAYKGVMEGTPAPVLSKR